MSDARASTRHSPTGPLASFGLALVGAVVASVCSAALVASADSLGRGLELLLVFLLLTGLECAAYVEALRPWLAGDRVPRFAGGLQVVLLVAVLATLAGGLELGGVGLSALAAGVFLPHACALRFRRVNQDLVEEDEPWLDQEGDPPGDQGTTPRLIRAEPHVGRVLGTVLDQERDRWLAWAAASLTVTVVCLAAGAPRAAVIGVDLLGVLALGVVAARLLSTHLALRDFEEALGEPRRAFVVILRDARPRGWAPLLAVWDEEPVPVGGRLPRADSVHRCEARPDALFSTRDAVVVHEAWVDSGRRIGSPARWVAADAGMCLLRHRAVLGARRIASDLDHHRPGRPRSLSMPAPNATTESQTEHVVTSTSEPVPRVSQLGLLLTRRTAVLALVAVLLWWIV